MQAREITEDFERQRLNFFSGQGADMKSRWLEDRHGREIYVMERGSGSPIVFLHGGGAQGSIWAPLVGRLASMGEARLIVADRPGCGLSGSCNYQEVPDLRKSASEFVEDLLDGLGLERAQFVGASMGGFFTLNFALDHPERVHRLVAAGAPAGVDRWIPLQFRLMGTPPLSRLLFGLARNPSEEDMRKLHTKLLVADVDRLSKEYLRIGTMAANLPGWADGFRTLLERFLDLRGVRDETYIRDEVAALDVPALFVWGDKDAFAPPSSGEDLVARMPNAQLVTIEDAGHNVWLDQLDACLEPITEFLEFGSAQRAQRGRRSSTDQKAVGRSLGNAS